MMAAMVAPSDSAARQLKLLGELVMQRRIALKIGSKEKAADRCGLSHVPYRNVEAGRSASDTTYAKIEKGFGILPGSLKAVIDGADSVPLADGTELIHGGRISHPTLESVDAEAKEAIAKAVGLTTPELTFTQAEAISARAIEELRKRGILPASS